ncbi:MAG TPA: hypothetical protein VMZ92_13870 [Planctomycetota bacterium]|nr:hypothetical protein [Planctomycetota bacterium]
MEFTVARILFLNVVSLINITLWTLLVIVMWRLMKATRTMSDTLKFILDEMSRRNELMGRSDDR